MYIIFGIFLNQLSQHKNVFKKKFLGTSFFPQHIFSLSPLHYCFPFSLCGGGDKKDSSSLSKVIRLEKTDYNIIIDKNYIS